MRKLCVSFLFLLLYGITFWLKISGGSTLKIVIAKQTQEEKSPNVKYKTEFAIFSVAELDAALQYIQDNCVHLSRHKNGDVENNVLEEDNAPELYAAGVMANVAKDMIQKKLCVRYSLILVI